MLSFIFRRLLSAIPFVILVSLTVFMLIQLPPGDYVDRWAEQQSQSGSVYSQQELDAMRHDLGLDRPLIIRYTSWVSGIVLHGDFGTSFVTNEPVSGLVGSMLGYTLLVTLGALFFGWMIALPIGIYSAVKRYSFGDYFFTFISFLGLAVPPFLLAFVMLILIMKSFGVVPIGLFSAEFQDPAMGWSMARFMDLMKHLILPIVIIGLSSSASLIRIMRANLIDQLSQPYVVTARAKGMTETSLLLKYPVRVALNPFVSTLGSVLPTLINGGTTVSVVLNIPIVGPALLTALRTQDIYMSGAILLMVCLMTVVGTLVSDILLAILDPRIRMD